MFGRLGVLVDLSIGRGGHRELLVTVVDSRRAVPAAQVSTVPHGRPAVLYVLHMTGASSAGQQLTAWRPEVPGIAEVFHARFVEHAYPAHTHDAWTLLIVDDGAIRYGLDRHQHGAAGATVTLLPPSTSSHDGRSVSGDGFRKRVLYLDTTILDRGSAGRRSTSPACTTTCCAIGSTGCTWRCATLPTRWRRRAGSPWCANVCAVTCMSPGPSQPTRHRHGWRHDLRDLLDSRTSTGITLREAARLLHAHPGHLVRSFTRAFGLPPHLYLTGRRVDQARRLLLAGLRPADVAVRVGFHDQSHLNRHFARHLGTSPGRYVR